MGEESDILKLQPSDNPGMSLVTTLLDGNNYFSWSRSIKIALGAKMKLSFINGKAPKPAEDAKNFEQWLRIDCMVTSWILNSISKEIVEAFLYTSTARELWLELETRFGQSNGPMIHQLQREISSISQGSMSISVYYTKLKKLWDELTCITPVQKCVCGASKAAADLNTLHQLMQFLRGLNESYDHVRNLILMIEPLPSVSKAYSMILRVEKQREVNAGITSSIQDVAMQIKGTDFRKTAGSKFLSPKLSVMMKLYNRKCSRSSLASNPQGLDTIFQDSS